MKAKVFQDLLKSIDEARAIRAGRRKPSRARRFRAALQAINRRHQRTLERLAGISPDLRREVGHLVREDRPLLKRLTDS